MATKKQRSAEFTTGVVVLEYPFLNRSRQFEGKGPFYYDVKATVSGTDAAELRRFVDEEIIGARQQFNKDKTSHDPLTEKEDAEGNSFIEFKAKVRAETNDGRSRKPVFYDASGECLAGREPNIASGTKARLCLRSYRWENPAGAGVSLQPVGVQLIEVVEYQGRSGKSMGFGATEGYTAPAQTDTDEGDTNADPASGADF